MDLSVLHIDKAMTNVSVAYSNAEFIAERIYPRVPVDLQSDKYFIFDKERFRASKDARRPGAESNEIDWGLSSDGYYADGHGLRQAIPDEWKKGSDPATDLDISATETLTDKILLNREINLVTYLTANATTVSQAGTKWDNNANDPIKIIDTNRETIMTASGKKPNKFFCSRPVWRAIKNNANVVGRITGAQRLSASQVTPADVATLFEVDEVIIADAVQNTAKKGQADALSFIWGKLAGLYYAPPAAGRRTVSWGYHFQWNVASTDPKAAAMLQDVPAGYLVYRFRVETRHAEIIETLNYYDQKQVASGAGLLFSNCIA